MTVYNAPPFVVDGPKPRPPLYRLIDAANVIEETDPHWQAGAQVWGYPSDLPHAWDPCSTGTNRTKVTGGTIAVGAFGAFVVYMTETCSALSVFTGLAADATEEEYQAAFVARALAQFNATESYAVEREFAGGFAIPNNPHLADPHCALLAGGAAVSPRVGLSYLADAVGATGKDGLIHAPPSVVVAWGLLRTYRDSNALYTVEGTPIAEGDGYIQLAPEPHSAPGAGKSWAWATGPVDIRRSEAVVYPGKFWEALDRGQNTVEYRVERTYLVDWDTVLQDAVLIDWTLTP